LLRRGSETKEEKELKGAEPQYSVGRSSAEASPKLDRSDSLLLGNSIFMDRAHGS